MRIKLLSNKTINRISAGEVIERPASAVKELVENAIDAGAKKITIRLERAGKNLISIADDGIGMGHDDLALAIQRHATSKLDEEDLLNITSFGFRGEALPSIGAVAKLKITSCPDSSSPNGNDSTNNRSATSASVGSNASTGTTSTSSASANSNSNNVQTNHLISARSIEVIGGNIGELESATRSQGTTVEVRDLFFATPARLKFLRSDRTELSAIMNIIKRIALGYPHIEFQVFHENKQTLHVRPGALDHSLAPGTHEKSEHLRKRIADILGNDFIQNSTQVDFAAENVHIYGYSCLPTYNRATGEEQYLFINNRPVKDKILNIALKVAYQDFIARDRFPVSVLFLEIPTNMVDVNVHPAKTEVRFYDPNTIRSMVISAIKEALSEANHRVSNTTAQQALKYMSKSQTSGGYTKSEQTKRPFSANVANDSFVSAKTTQQSPFFTAEEENFRAAPTTKSALPTASLTSATGQKPSKPMRSDYELAMGTSSSNITERSLAERSLNKPMPKLTPGSQMASAYGAENRDVSYIYEDSSTEATTQLAPKILAAEIEHPKDSVIPKTVRQENMTAIAAIAKGPPVADIYEATTDSEQYRSYPLGAAKAQLHGTYIISQTDDSIIITDQHAAHERLGYEKIKATIAKNGLTKQRLLIPEIIEMQDEALADALIQHSKELNDLGLGFEKFGDKSIIVSEIPSLIGDSNVVQLVKDIADHLHESGENIALTELIEHVTETYACHYAIRSGRKLKGEEMNELLRQMEKTPFSGQCNHGRPTYVQLKLADIEKLFGRR